jgi:hypothetical protein
MPVPMLQNSQLSRRRFLIASAAAAVGAGTGPGLGISEALAQARLASPSDFALRQLAKSLTGPLLRPTDFDFAKFVMPYNLRYAGNLPQAVALCVSPKDVAAAILWCRELDLPFVARSGGHSYAGYSTTNGLLIDLSLMASASFDPARKIVRAGGGARNQNLYDTLEKGDAAMTHGRCGTVGAAGFLLGGGIGFNMRGNGLACDQLIETEIVTADGAILTLNERNNADLFWACRGGGGGNFGINTAFVLQAFATEPVTVFELEWTSRPEEVFAALMPALDAAPENLGSRVSLAAVTPARRAAGQDVVVHLLGQLRGHDKQHNDSSRRTTRQTISRSVRPSSPVLSAATPSAWRSIIYAAGREQAPPPTFGSFRPAAGSTALRRTRRPSSIATPASSWMSGSTGAHRIRPARLRKIWRGWTDSIRRCCRSRPAEPIKISSIRRSPTGRTPTTAPISRA